MEYTNFMKELLSNIESTSKYKEKKMKIEGSTKSLYMRYLLLLNNKKPFEDLKFLCDDIEGVHKKISGYAMSTQKTVYLIINRVLNLPFVESTQSKLFPLDKCKIEYKKDLDLILEKWKERDTNSKTKKQRENWISWEEIKDNYNYLYKEFKNELKDKNDNPLDLSYQEYKKLLILIILSIFVSDEKIPPRRSEDYYNMIIIMDKKTLKKKLLDKRVNICALNEEKFIFNNYKTKRAYGTVILDMPNDTVNLLKIYVFFHENYNNVNFENNVYLFLKYDGEPYKDEQIIYHLLSSFFDKKIGVNILRNIFASSEYKIIKDQKKELIKKSENIAKNMGTSLEMLDKVYTKED